MLKICQHFTYVTTCFPTKEAVKTSPLNVLMHYLKVLSNEMDPAEIRLIRYNFFKGIVASGF